MRTIFILFTMVFTFCMCVPTVADAQIAEKVGSVFTNSVDSVYHDGKAVVDSVYHDGKSAINTLYSDGKAGLSNVYPDIRSAVISIGKAIGIAAEHVYGVLVKKYFVMGVKQLGICLIGFISFIIGIIMWKKATPVGQPITYRVIVPLVLFIGGICTMAHVDYNEMLMGLLNPEYGAINYILEYSKTLIK